MHFPEGLENTPFKWKIYLNFVALSEYPNFVAGKRFWCKNRFCQWPPWTPGPSSYLCFRRPCIVLEKRLYSYDKNNVCLWHLLRTVLYILIKRLMLRQKRCALYTCLFVQRLLNLLRSLWFLQGIQQQFFKMSSREAHKNICLLHTHKYLG